MERKLLLLVVSLLCAAGIQAQESFTSGYLRYSVTDADQKFVTVCGHTTELPTKVEIPTTVSYEGIDYVVTAIGGYALYDCSMLEQIIIPESVITIGESAFRECSSLSQIIIPDRVTVIGNSAFRDCSSLEQIIISDSTTTIGDCAFLGCHSLKQIAIPESVITIGDYAFLSCFLIKQVTIPDKVTTIGKHAFGGCPSLTQVFIGNGVITIGDGAFSACGSLSQITIGNSVRTIGDGAFFMCPSLTQITVRPLTPPTLEYTELFPFDCDSSIPVFVPEGSLEAYKASDWNYFTNLQEDPNGNVQQPTLAEGVRYADGQLLNPQQLFVSVYDLTGRLVYRGNDSARAFPSGVYIVSYGRTTEEMVF